MVTFKHVTEVVRNRCVNHQAQRVYSPHCNFCWGINNLNYQTNKQILLIKPTICQCITLQYYTVHCIIKTRAQIVRRYQGKKTSEKSEIVTYKDATPLFRYICVNQQAKKLDSRANILLHAVKTNLFLGINSLNYQTNKQILSIKQTI